jgi:hypothetical protein
MTKLQFTILAAAVLALPLYARQAKTPRAGAPSNSANGNMAEASGEYVVTNLQPFTHVAYVPAGADLSSIRFDSIKAVKVASTRTTVQNYRYCLQTSQEPGGSMYCPYVQDSSPVPAYRVTYSYSAPPLASDEYSSTRFTFSVVLRPEDLDSSVLQTMSAGKIGRAAAAEGFKFTTSRDSVQEIVIDEANSSLCAGNYIDGVWAHSSPVCEDRVAYKTVTVPSDYFTVTVDRASAPAAALTAQASVPRRP